MLLGILSDTHGHVQRSAAAAQLLLEAGVESVVHCGDIGSEAVLVELASVFGPAHVGVSAVLGNVDWMADGLMAFPASTGVAVVGQRAEVDLAGKRGVVLHGHEARALRNALHSGEYDYVFTGHTHVKQDERFGKTRLINPGAVYRAAEPSIATLDVTTDTLTFIALD